MPTSVYSLEEERHRAALEITKLQRQEAFVQFPDKSVRKIKTHDVQRPCVGDELVEAFKQQVYEASDYTIPVDEAKRRIEVRLQEIQQRVQEPIIRDGEPIIIEPEHPEKPDPLDDVEWH